MTKLGNLSPEGSIAIGVIVCLLSSGIQSLGLTLQRKSHMLEETQYFDSPRPPYKRRRWQLGFTLFLVANLVGSTIQLSILPLPVLAALQAAGLVFNSLNATWILGEDFTRWSLGGTLLVSGGALLIAYFGALPEPAHTLNQLLALFARHQFIAWAVVQLFLVLLVFAILYLMKRLSPSRGASKKLRLARGMCYGALSGMLSAHSLLMAKSAVELLVRTIADGENQFSHWQSWIILIVLVTIGLSQLYCLHAGLQLCSTSVLYPFVFCVYNVITILDGLIYFNQSSQLGAMESGLIVLGTFILLSGVFCLSWRLATEDVSGTKAAEVIENPLTPGIGVIGTPIGAHDIRRADERQPLLAGSPAGASPESPYIFRPRRSSMQGKGLGDEEARVGMSESGGQAPESPALDRPKPPKQRKRATFADFGTMSASSHRERSSTNPGSPAIRRPSVLSIYNKTKTRRINPADNRALWGELEEAGSPPGWRAMAKSEIVSAGLPVSREFPPATKKWRRMSEGASQVLRAGGSDVGFRKAARRVSDTAGSSGKGSIGSGVKHGDPGQAVVEEDEDDEEEERDDDEEEHDAMASSMPLLQRAETGRTYRVVSGDARRRRSSIVEGERASMEARRRWRESYAGSVAGARGRGRGGSVGGGGNEDDGSSSWLWGWHTIDSSHGRPSDDEDEEMNRRRRSGYIAHGGAGGAGGGRGWDWESWKRWVGRRKGEGGEGGGAEGQGNGERQGEGNGSSNNER